MDLAGKVAFVTGGSGDIGRAIAEAFSAAGAQILITGKSEQDVETCTADLPPSSTIKARAMDVTSPAEIAGILRQLGRLDVLVNAAGTIQRAGREFEPEGFAEVIDVNLVGTMRVSTAASELLFASRGCIIVRWSVTRCFVSMTIAPPTNTAEL